MKHYFPARKISWLVSWAFLYAFTLQVVYAEPTGRIFITNEKGNTVSVINGETLEIEGEIAIGERPRGIGISPDGTEVYVAVSEENLIAVFDPKTLEILRKFQSGSDPETFAVHPNGNIYISNEDDAKATVYNPRTGDLIAEIQVGLEPEGVAISPDGSKVIVTSESTNMLHVITVPGNTITDNILKLTETNLEKVEGKSKLKKRIFYVLVEGLQNITRHQNEIQSKLPNQEGIFAISKRGSKYFITTGNLIKNQGIQPLTEKIEKINSLEKDELKNYYVETLKKEGFSPKGGAGLGLIEMARKTGNKLKFDFRKIDDRYSFFYLRRSVHPSITSSLWVQPKWLRFSRQDYILKLASTPAQKPPASTLKTSRLI